MRGSTGYSSTPNMRRSNLPAVADQLRIIGPSASAAIVRPAWNDAVLFKRILDVGAQTLLVPYVESGEEARRAVSAARYPPLGRRGVATTHRANRYGRIAEYYARATEETCVLVQLETTQAVAVLEEIADVDGVDGVFIGPSDLAASLGLIGQPAHPEPRKLIADACKRAKAIGIPIGILAPVEADAHMFLDMGFSFVAVGSENRVAPQSNGRATRKVQVARRSLKVEASKGRRVEGSKG